MKEYRLIERLQYRINTGFYQGWVMHGDYGVVWYIFSVTKPVSYSSLNRKLFELEQKGFNIEMPKDEDSDSKLPTIKISKEALEITAMTTAMPLSLLSYEKLKNPPEKYVEAVEFSVRNANFERLCSMRKLLEKFVSDSIWNNNEIVAIECK